MSAASKAVAVSSAAAVPVPGTTAEIVAFRPPLRPALERAGEMVRHVAGIVVPPLVVIGLSLFVWQLLCSEPGARLPPPTKVVADAWDFIVDPFYDNGGIDKGLFWHLSASLQRVAYGYSIAAIVGIALGTLVGAFIIAVIQNGMNLTGVESYTQKVVLGLVILGAVLLDILKRRGWQRWKPRGAQLRTALTQTAGSRRRWRWARRSARAHRAAIRR